MNRADVDRLRAETRLSDVVRMAVTLHAKHGSLSGLCPFHKEKTPSFHVSDKRGTFKCFGCGAHGDVFDFLMLHKGLTFPAALAWVASDDKPLTAHAAVPEYQGRPTADEDELRRIRHAHDLWLRRLPATDTMAEAYLWARGIVHIPTPDIIGFLPHAYCSPLQQETPALIAPLQDENGHVTAVQLVFLNPATGDAWRDGAGKRIKRTMGVMRKGAVRLGLPDLRLGIAGSVEDALSASALFSLPCWATCGESRLATVWVPPDVGHLIIFADADEAGRRFAEDAARRQKRDGLHVEIAAPEWQKDWNDALTAGA